MLGFFRKRRRSGAGLFAFGTKLQYLSLGGTKGSFSVEKCVDLPQELPPSQGDLFADADTLEANLLRLKERLGGKWGPPVSVGIQAKDVLVRIVEMPRLEPEDLRDAFRFEFDKYFPFPAQEACFDIAPIDHPSAREGGDQVHAVVAACRLHPMELFLTAADRLGLEVEAVEPSMLSLFRCLQGPNLPPEEGNLYVMAGVHSSLLVVGYRDHGILFRNVAHGFQEKELEEGRLQSFAREVYSTANFSNSQFRNLPIRKIYLGGYGSRYGEVLREGIESMSGIPVTLVDPWDLWNVQRRPDPPLGWEVVLGLALRSQDRP